MKYGVFPASLKEGGDYPCNWCGMRGQGDRLNGHVKHSKFYISHEGDQRKPERSFPESPEQPLKTSCLDLFWDNSALADPAMNLIYIVPVLGGHMGAGNEGDEYPGRPGPVWMAFALNRCRNFWAKMGWRIRWFSVLRAMDTVPSPVGKWRNMEKTQD